VSLSDINVNGSIQTRLIVTPAKNEAETLQRLGGCLVEQTWRPDAWIVDNGSTDGTQDVVTAQF
jgi:glycosyltransferase involved in cell wall biosynthesis